GGNRNPANSDVGAGGRTRRRRMTRSCLVEVVEAADFVDATDPHGSCGQLPDGQKAARRTQAAIRAHDERGFAVLKNWHVLDRYRGYPWRVSIIVQEILTMSISDVTGQAL
ncbi:hypothetical protein AB1460_37175, partial [Parafrankia sp. FMc2]